MKLRRIALVATVLIALAAFWLLWNRPRRADMTTYVPAESLAYLEVNDLQGIVDGITNTTSWKTLAGPANAKLGVGGSRWLITLAKWTGIGTTEAVVLSRSQFAATLLELDSADAGTTLQVNLVAALVIETHTSESRMRPLLERRIEEFARHRYGQPRWEHKVIDGVDFTEWISPDGRRQIVSAFVGTVAYVGSEEAPVRACIAVRRGARISLAGNRLLREMRDRVAINNASLFGFASSAGLKSFVIATAPYVFGPEAASTNAPQLLATAVPKLVDGLAWAPHFVDGQIEDRYIAALTSGVARQLSNGLVPDTPPALRAVDLVPRTTYSLTAYSFRDSATAWSDLNLAVSSHVDFVTAVVAPRALNSLLDSYGIDDPKAFLSAVGPEITTARLDDNSSRALLIAEILDGPALRKLVQRRLGPGSTSQQIGDAELNVSTNPDRGTVAFIRNYVLMGSKDDVLRCLEATSRADSLAANDSFRRAQRLRNPSTRPTSTTFSNDEHSARSFVLLFSADRTAVLSNNVAALTDASKPLPYSIAVTQLSENGFERTTRSSFGFLGTLLVQFASGEQQ